MEKVICSNCGSVYHLTSNHIPVRDKDTIECQVCGTQIFSWNESKIWYSKLVERHENHLNE